MVQIRCKYCLTTDVVLKEKGPHVGAYCANCGRWLKWLSKNEKNFVDFGIKLEPAKIEKNEIDSTDEEVPW